MIEKWLRDHGPLWAAGKWFGADLVGHVVVIIGISNGKVIYLDPSPDMSYSGRREKSLADVKALLTALKYAP